jgi:hypothetical protein
MNNSLHQKDKGRKPVGGRGGNRAKQEPRETGSRRAQVRFHRGVDLAKRV